MNIHRRGFLRSGRSQAVCWVMAVFLLLLQSLLPPGSQAGCGPGCSPDVESSGKGGIAIGYSANLWGKLEPARA